MHFLITLLKKGGYFNLSDLKYHKIHTEGGESMKHSSLYLCHLSVDHRPTIVETTVPFIRIN